MTWLHRLWQRIARFFDQLPPPRGGMMTDLFLGFFAIILLLTAQTLCVLRCMRLLEQIKQLLEQSR